MSEVQYLWQSGNKVSIEKSTNAFTIEGYSPSVVFDKAEELEIRVRRIEPVTNGTLKIEVDSNRDEAMDRLREGNIVHHLYNTLGNTNDQIIVSDSIYVSFANEQTEDFINELLASMNLIAIESLENNTYLVSVTNEVGANPIKVANLLAEYEFVKFAEPNLVHTLQKFSPLPNDPMFSKQWHLNAFEIGENLVNGCDINVLEAWRVTQGIRDVVLCVADDGFDLAHPDFQGTDKIAHQANIKLSGLYDIEIDNDVRPRSGDIHGTPCAALAIAEANSSGITGVAPGCSFFPLRFPRNIKDNQLIKVLKYISQHADILSFSWGVPPSQRPLSSPLGQCIDKIYRSGGRQNRGLLICVAAGNYNCPIKDYNNRRVYKYFDGFGVLQRHSGPIDRWIAADANVLTVSASTSMKNRAAYSSWGQEVNLCAPSNNFDDLRRFSPRGLGITTADNEVGEPNSDLSPGSQFTDEFGGTSAAAPIVAGVCALVLSANRNLSAPEVAQLIMREADKDLLIASETEVNTPGEFVNGFSPWYGYGKVNAGRSIRAAVASS